MTLLCLWSSSTSVVANLPVRLLAALAALTLFESQKCGQCEEYVWTAGEKERYEEFIKLRGEGKLAEAAQAGEKWVEISEVIRGNAHHHNTRSLNSLGFFFKSIGRDKEAEALFLRSSMIIEYLEELTFSQIEKGYEEAAMLIGRKAIWARQTSLNLSLSLPDEDDRLGFQRKHHTYDLVGNLESAPEIAEAVLMNKGIVLESILEDRSDVTGYRNGQQVRLKEEEGALKPLSIGYRDVQEVLPLDMGLVEYFRYRRYLGEDLWEDSYGVVILKTEGAPVFVKCGAAVVIDPLIADYLTAVESVAYGKTDEELIRKLSRNLYDLLIKGLSPYLEDLKTTVICPDSTLNFVPFATLLDSQSRFFSESYNIYYVASGRDLLRKNLSKLRKVNSAVVAGNPAFQIKNVVQDPPLKVARGEKTDSLVANLRSGVGRDLSRIRLNSLPGTRVEAMRVKTALEGDLGKPQKVFLGIGEGVTEASLRRLHSPRVLHLATHGFFLNDHSETKSAELQGGSNSAHSEKSIQNPMYRSGIALSGAQNTFDKWRNGEIPDPLNDGILLAAEASDLDLRGTELVTLSACKTGIGETLSGEGVLGLRRGFVMSGASNVLMTLWDIADEPTADFMEAFYQKYVETGNAPNALSEVQNEWLVKLRREKGLAVSIYSSGPFVLSAQAAPTIEKEPVSLSSATKETPFVNTLGMTFVPVEGTDALFSIWETRVQDYAAYASDNPEIDMEWKDYEYESKDGTLHKQKSTHPVVNVSWEDAKGFCEWLSKKENVLYRLPTDSEWSMAAEVSDRENASIRVQMRKRDSKFLDDHGVDQERGYYPPEFAESVLTYSGDLIRYPWGDSWPPPSGAGNFSGRESAFFIKTSNYEDDFSFTAPVGSFIANKTGIYNLNGNVSEWCEDWHSMRQEKRAYRGASWTSFAKNLNGATNRYTQHHTDFSSSYRFSIKPTSRSYSRGFRVVLTGN